METYSSMTDAWHWLLNSLGLVSMPCMLGLGGSFGMQIDRYWVCPTSDKSLRKPLGKVFNRSCRENCGIPNLLSHSDDLGGIPQ